MTKPPRDRFGWLTPVYDLLAGLVFGRAIRESQTYFLSFVPAETSVLIVGGGTGWIIPEVFKAQPNCSICFVDASKRMIETARKNHSRDGVSFVHGTVLDIPSKKFGIIVLPFFLDMFSPPKIEQTISDISEHTNDATVWLVTDFVDNHTRWGRALLFVMYRFFRLICSIDAEKLPDWELGLLHHHLQPEKSKSFYGKLIKSKIFVGKA